MFCRTCHYDLRGQIESRCPECGRAFDPADERTYLPRLPRLRDRLLPTRWRVLAAGVFTMALVVWYAEPWAAHRISCGLGPFPAASFANFESIVTAWLGGRVPRATGAPRDLRSVTASLPPALSPHTQPDALIARLNLGRYLVQRLKPRLLPFALYAAAMSFVFRRLWRRAFLATAVVSVLAFPAATRGRDIAAAIYPGSHAYVDDYVYRIDVDWVAENSPGQCMVVYERAPLQGLRLVAFMDGHIARVAEPEFQALAAEQGIVIASPN